MHGSGKGVVGRQNSFPPPAMGLLRAGMFWLALAYCAHTARGWHALRGWGGSWRVLGRAAQGAGQLGGPGERLDSAELYLEANRGDGLIDPHMGYRP
jgi:hypothetical protein